MNYEHKAPIIATAVPISNNNAYSATYTESYSNSISNNLAGPIINEAAAREYLSSYPYNWPKGLQETLIQNSLPRFPIRFFICDDSGSVISYVLPSSFDYLDGNK